jgi:hypothetical protein
MTEPLDPEIKRLRQLKPGELADEVGGIKAQIADLEAARVQRKVEVVRRGLDAADGQLFHPTMPAGSAIADQREDLAPGHGRSVCRSFFARSTPTG